MPLTITGFSITGICMFDINLVLTLLYTGVMSLGIALTFVKKIGEMRTNIDEVLEYRELSQEYEEENLLDEIHRGYLEILQSERMNINNYSAKKLTLNNNPNKKKR